MPKMVSLTCIQIALLYLATFSVFVPPFCIFGIKMVPLTEVKLIQTMISSKLLESETCKEYLK